MGTACTLFPLSAEGPIDCYATLETGSKALAHRLMDLTDPEGAPERPSQVIEGPDGDERVQMVTVAEIVDLIDQGRWPEQVICAFAYILKLPRDRKVGVRYD